MKKGDIYVYSWPDWPENELIPRPGKALIIQNNTSNEYFPTAIIVPLIKTETKIHYPMQCDFKVCGRAHRAHCEIIGTVPKSELRHPLGHLSEQDIKTLDRCLAVSFGMIGWRDRYDPKRAERMDQ